MKRSMKYWNSAKVNIKSLQRSQLMMMITGSLIKISLWFFITQTHWTNLRVRTQELE